MHSVAHLDEALHERRQVALALPRLPGRQVAGPGPEQVDQDHEADAHQKEQASDLGIGEALVGG
eukprot:CAMPEP_0177377480 /NCGR_PEP_ID=MMETSP0368-20130122/45793_1 /TAXON_ID=447022 ORGANISM="Scrippsiella hangoei-like, Strain SHHI-4" /NCGR_SAMPLE_ID=MMETSP0368 /ASSEMBLY_ACC=CAM_ASM_000363 /LENGTH=63 /DNA_ID=CAMNT_0018841305 /DNA_START=35 /DNA_END=223 /DNA_ORIENTATION=-